MMTRNGRLMRPGLFWVFYSGLVLLSQQTPALSQQTLAEKPTENQDIAMLKKAPSIVGDRYQCREMVQVVNHLRELGKDRSLAVLRDYLMGGGDHDKVLIICRLLFINPKGWEPPILGECVP